MFPNAMKKRSKLWVASWLGLGSIFGHSKVNIDTSFPLFIEAGWHLSAKLTTDIPIYLFGETLSMALEISPRFGLDTPIHSIHCTGCLIAVVASCRHCCLVMPSFL
jgi:hypothetical protein